MRRKKAAWLRSIIGSKKFIICAVLIVLLNLVKLNALKTFVEDKVTSLAGAPFKINGDIKLGIIGVMPAIKLGGIVFSGVTADNIELAPNYSFNGFLADITGINASGAYLGDYSANVKLLGSGFEMSDIDGDLKGGDILGNISLLDKIFKADFKLRDVPYYALLPDFKGSFDADLQLQSSGSDYASIVRGLNGKLLLVGGSGTIHNTVLKLWGTDLITAVLTEVFTKKDLMKLNCTVADVDVKGGVASIKSAVIDADEMVISSKGSVNFNNQKIKLKVKPLPRNASLINFASPLNIEGKIYNPTIVPEPSELAQKLGGMLLTAVNPAAALLPLIRQELDGDESICGKYAGILK